MTSDYLSKHFNFISVYNGLFSHFNYYKSLCSDASKYIKMMHKRFLKGSIVKNSFANANKLYTIIFNFIS